MINFAIDPHSIDTVETYEWTIPSILFFFFSHLRLQFDSQLETHVLMHRKTILATCHDLSIVN